MVVGVRGRVTRDAAELVEREHKPREELARTPHLRMEGEDVLAIAPTQDSVINSGARILGAVVTSTAAVHGGDRTATAEAGTTVTT